MVKSGKKVVVCTRSPLLYSLLSRRLPRDIACSPVYTFQREVYQRIYRCDVWRSVTKALVDIQCTGGFANMSGGKS